MKKLLMILFFMCSCSHNIAVHTDYDPDFDLWNYRTFAWLRSLSFSSELNASYYTQYNEKTLKRAVEQGLFRKGYFLTTESPDIIIHYSIVTYQPPMLAAEPIEYLYCPYGIRLFSSEYQYAEGTLILDVRNTSTNTLIWRGWAESVLDKNYSRQEINNRIDDAIAKMFKDFPSAKPLRHEMEMPVTKSI